MNVIRLAVIGSALVAGLASCKKDDENNVKPDGGTKTSFSDKKWQPVSLIIDPALDIDGDGKPDKDLMQFMPACQKDDIVVFQKDGKVMNDNGSNRCEANEAKTEQTGTWTYDEAAKTIKIKTSDNPSEVESWQIVESTSTTLKVRYDFQEEGQTFKATLAMQGQ